MSIGSDNRMIAERVWLAAAIELLSAITAIVFVAALAGAAAVFGLLALPLSFLAGVGWMYIGRPGVGCAILAVRAVLLGASFMVALVYTLVSIDCHSNCPNENWKLVLWIVVAMLFAGVPLVSAVTLLVTQSKGGAKHQRDSTG